MAHYVRRGAVAGLLAGVALALFLLIVGERSLSQAVSLQNARAVAETGSSPEQMFTRGGQLVGGALASVVFGAGMGALFGIAYAALRHRLPGQDDWQRAMWLAVGAWVVVWAVPATKYPPNPPGVGDPETITRRTLLWLTLVAWSLLSVWASGRFGPWLKARGASDPTRLTGQVIAYVALIVVAALALPPTGDPITPSANLIWHFRIASAGGQLLLWSVLGMVFGLLAWRGDHRPKATTVTPSMAPGA
ncbi:MAG: CbtA family protein [Actinomycetota bacterium]